MKKVETYISGKPPTKEDIDQLVGIANSGDVVVHLVWHVPYSGTYDKYIYPMSDAQKVFDELPKRYGV